MKVSVITINYNNRSGLEVTVPSVLQQDYPHLEYIIIDGASTDGSADAILQYADKITYWVSEKDTGIYNAMNKGIRQATGDFVMFVNSGDTLYTANTISLLCNGDTDADVIYGDLLNVNLRTGEETKEISKENMTFKWWYWGYSIPHSGALIRRSRFEELGLYDENLRIVSDWKWYMQGYFFHGFRFLKKDTVTARFALDGISSNLETSHLIYAERAKVMQAEFPKFYPDYEEIYSGGTRRIGYLIQIQKYPIARKIATILLQILSKIRW